MENKKECLICGVGVDSKSISSHLRIHNIDREYYSVEYLKLRNTCLGCGKTTKFISTFVGFKTYCFECGKKSQSKDFLIKVYGKEIGIEKWNIINEKRKYSNSLEGLKNNHGEEWVEEKLKEFAKGPEILKELRKDEEYNEWFLGRQSTNVGYYIKQGMTEDEAKEALKLRQTTFNLEKCIERYGEEEGKKVWKERQDKWQETLNSKPPEEIERINKLKAQAGCVNAISDIERKFLDLLEQFYDIIVERQTLMFFETINSHRSFDGRYKNILIEFQGSYWHCDPRMYEANYFHPQKERTAEEIWDYDSCKQKLANENGYKVFIVWEKDCKEDIYKEVKRFEEFYES